MGHAQFLVGQNAPVASDLPTSIADLEDKSIVFSNRWNKQDYQRAGSVSLEAMALLDFISAQLLREKVERKGLGTYAGSAFAAEMNTPCGSGVSGVSLTDQQAMVAAGAGAGSIASHLGPCGQLTLDRLLNKIKHRNPRLVNFRIEQGRHFFLVCPEHTEGGSEGIYEFDVISFCERCGAAANAL